NGKDSTDEFIALANWDRNQLPGDWVDEGGLEEMTMHRMTAVPMVFGVVPMSVRSVSDADGRLESIEVTYLDAGAFFGYRPGGDKAVAAAKDSIEARKRRFREIYAGFDEEIRKNLQTVSGGEGKAAVIGRTQFLRGRSLDYVSPGFSLRYQAVADNALRLTIVREGEATNHYLEDELVEMDRAERGAWFSSKVKREKSGDVVLSGMPVFRQGVRPYCAISTLGMVTHYLGLRISVEGLAAAAGFRNDGTAGGTKLLELYAASAQEAKVRSSRSGKFDFERAQRSLDAGFPVLVWRKYDSDRDRLHTEFARLHRASPNAELPEVDDAERATWPGDEGRNHASVVTGFNNERGEVIFVESWGEHTRGRRMRFEELEETSYMAFYYSQ
ncbi:MAG: C39 family peptidase, partial [Verrucomicrobiales bacterium]